MLFSFLFVLLNQLIVPDAPLQVDITYITSGAASSSAGIQYVNGQLLTIEDFKGKAEPNSEAVAITSSGYAFKAGFRSNRDKAALSIQVFCTFNKDKSWMKPFGKNPYVLAHEQIHFDISFLSCMQFIEELKQAKFSTSNYSSLIEKIYNRSIYQLENMQHAYDSETSNGRLPKKQQEWSSKIKAQLNDFDVNKP